MSRWLVASDRDFSSCFQAFLEEKRDTCGELRTQVAQILETVRNEGDSALRQYSKLFDKFQLPAEDGFAVPREAFESALEICDPETVAALRFAAQRIEVFHRRQVPDDLWFRDECGVELGYQWKSLGSVGIYVPGGTAAYPSSVLMNAIPARIAGVERIVMVTPTPLGCIEPLLLAAALIAGVKEIYRLGGAQAIAALAFGSESIDRVDKIVGPGNAYVAEAKRQVFGVCGIDSIAGPSEIVVLADKNNDPDWIAADLLSQAEHDISSRSVLICDCEVFARRTVSALEQRLPSLPREEIARKSWENCGAVVIVSSLQEGVALINRLAPEHLEIAASNQEELVPQIDNAGAIFLGAHTPETIGDYVAGTNHVLPTNGSARFTSGLSVLDFLKRSSLLRCTAESLENIAHAAITLAQAEKFQAHADAVRLRLEKSA